jgi:hypothetical protein
MKRNILTLLAALSGLAAFKICNGAEPKEDTTRGWAEISVAHVRNIEDGVSLELLVQGPMKIPANAVNIQGSFQKYLSLSIDDKELGWLGTPSAVAPSNDEAFVDIPENCRVLIIIPIKEHEIYLEDPAHLERIITVKHSSFPDTTAKFKISKKHEVIPEE